MKASDKTALVIGAVGTWIYVANVEPGRWGHVALGAGIIGIALAVEKIGDYVDECREEREEREEERRNRVFTAWIRSGSVKEGGE